MCNYIRNTYAYLHIWLFDYYRDNGRVHLFTWNKECTIIIYIGSYYVHLCVIKQTWQGIKKKLISYRKSDIELRFDNDRGRYLLSFWIVCHGKKCMHMKTMRHDVIDSSIKSNYQNLPDKMFLKYIFIIVAALYGAFLLYIRFFVMDL